MEQKRFLLALILSAGILFAWSYFFPSSSPQPGNSNSTVPQPSVVPSVPSPNADTVTTPQQSPQIETAIPASAIPREEPIVITGPKLLIIFVAACALALIARKKKKSIENLKLKKGVFYHFLKHSLELLTILIIATLVYTVLWMIMLIAANHATLRFLLWLETSLTKGKSFYGSYLKLSALQILLVMLMLYFLGLWMRLSKWVKGYQTWSRRIYTLLIILCSFSLFGTQRGEATIQDLRVRIVLVRQGYAEVRQRTRDALSVEAAVKVYPKIRDSFPPSYRNALESQGKLGARVRELRSYYNYAQGQYEIKSDKAEAIIKKAVAQNSADAEAVAEIQAPEQASDDEPTRTTAPEQDSEQISYTTVKEAQTAIEKREEEVRTKVITFLKHEDEGGKDLVLHLPKVATGDLKRELFSSWYKTHPIVEPLVDIFINTINDQIKGKLETAIDRITGKIIQQPEATQAVLDKESSRVIEQVAINIPPAILEKARQASQQLENDLAHIEEAKVQIDNEVKQVVYIRIENVISQLRNPEEEVSEKASATLSKSGDKISKTQVDELISIMRHGGQRWKRFLNREGHCDYFEYTSVKYYAASALEDMKSPYVSEETVSEAREARNAGKTTGRVTDPGWI